MAKKITFYNNLSSLRAQTRGLSLETLNDLWQKLTQVREERHQQEQQAKRAITAYNEKVEQYLALIKSEGLTLADLVEKSDFPAFKKLRKKRPTRPPKYKYIDEQGNLQTWTGQGRMPKPMQQAIAQHKKKLTDFLI